jgi:hypothetical protein
MANKRKAAQIDRRTGKPDRNRDKLFAYVLLLLVAFTFRVAVARFLPNDSPDDGRVYAQIARNVLEHHVYSHESEAPFASSLIRMPGYPLYVAGIYAVFGHGNQTAVRIFQALTDTATCLLIAMVAYLWEPDEARKRQSSIAALALAAVCPFTTIYVATILSETPTMFFAIAMCLTATLALKLTNQRRTLWLWIATGLLAGVAVLFRPDSGLFALAIGLTLVVATLGRSDVKLSPHREKFLLRTARTSYLGAVFSLAFCLVLVPWAVRNYRVFHLFQPLSPAHAEMPGEFVPRGYLTWVRTWIDEPRYIAPAIWQLDTTPIKLTDLPARAFDSPEEKQRVAALFEKYNHPSEAPDLFAAEPNATPAEPEDQSHNQQAETDNNESDRAANQNSDEDGEDSGDEEDDQSDESDSAAESSAQDVEMTPEIDASFAEIARERIARHPFRYYVWLPLKRARALWFDTHSDFYPFQGDLLPLADLDYDIHQQYWLPLFAGLTFIYSVLGILGGWFLWRTQNFNARLWLLLAALMIFLRIGFFSTLENPEPRYVVEVFPFLCIVGGIAVARILSVLRPGAEGAR